MSSTINDNDVAIIQGNASLFNIPVSLTKLTIESGSVLLLGNTEISTSISSSFLVNIFL